MLTLLKNWTGTIDIDDKHYMSVEDATSDFKRTSDKIHIVLHSMNKKRSQSALDASEDKVQYRSTVKKYMTMKSSPGFDFMAKLLFFH